METISKHADQVEYLTLDERIQIVKELYEDALVYRQLKAALADVFEQGLRDQIKAEISHLHMSLQQRL